MDDPLLKFAQSGPRSIRTVYVRSKSQDDTEYEVTIAEKSGRLTMYCRCLAGSKQQMCHHKRSLLGGDVSALAKGTDIPVLEGVLASPAYRAIQHRFEQYASEVDAIESQLSPLLARKSAVKKRFGAELKPTGSNTAATTLRAKPPKGRHAPVLVEFHAESETLCVQCHCEEGQVGELCHHVVGLLKNDQAKLYDDADAAVLLPFLSSPGYPAIRARLEQYEYEMGALHAETNPFERRRSELNREMAALIRPG
jgi:hypothetical protein